MVFIILGKFRRKLEPQDLPRTRPDIEGPGGKILFIYWTLGRYDAVATIEAKDDKTAMKIVLNLSDQVTTETLVAAPREEAIKLL